MFLHQPDSCILLPFPRLGSQNELVLLASLFDRPLKDRLNRQPIICTDPVHHGAKCLDEEITYLGNNEFCQFWVPISFAVRNLPRND
jgi:hypothetical protein